MPQQRATNSSCKFGSKKSPNLDADLDAVPDNDPKQADEHADDHAVEHGDKQTDEHADEHSRRWCLSKLSSVEVVEVFFLTAIYKKKFLQLSPLYCCLHEYICLLVCGELYYDEQTECPLLNIAGWTITDC